MKAEPVLRGRALLGGALAAAILAGCDLTGEYDKKFQEALATAGQRAVFDMTLFPSPTEITDADRKSAGVSLRIPTFFDAQSKSLPPTEGRAHPPFVKLPGLSYAIEKLDDDKTPVYVYFAAVPKADQKADALQVALSQQVVAALPGSAWSDKQLRTPDGQNVTFKMLRAAGPQEFLKSGQAAKLDGRLDLYLIDGPSHHVLIGWRAAKSSADKLQFEAATEAAMGTVSGAQGGAEGGAAPKSGCF